MARVFVITAATTSAQLDASGRGEASFTVSNASGRPIRGRAFARAAGAAQAAWFRVSGDAERSFPVSGTHQLSVSIAVPPGSPAGTYSFRLDVVSAENPDEDFAEGPAVSFEVAPSAPARTPFPWWILAAIAAILIVIGGLVTWLLSGRQPSAGDTATDATGVRRLRVQYASGWVDYRALHRDDPSVYAGVAAWRAGDLCVVQGVAQAWGPAGIAGQPQIATLPADCRPGGRLIFNVNNHANTARVDVLPDGTVTWVAGGADPTWISLSGVAFPVGTTTPVEFGPTWTNYGEGYAIGSVARDGSLCVAAGLVKTLDPAGIASRPPIATLPEGCRPKGRAVFNLNNHTRTARVDVTPDGQVLWVAGGGDYGWMSLDGVIIATSDGGALDFGPSWTSYGAEYAPGVVRTEKGLCVVGGLVKTSDPGGVAARPHIATLPEACRPRARLIFNLNNHARTARVDVLPDGRILWVAGGADSGWISLDGLVLVPGGDRQRGTDAPGGAPAEGRGRPRGGQTPP
jgi:hypothetical protein